MLRARHVSAESARITAGLGEEAAERLRLALDLCEAGEMVMRQNLRRRFPSASVQEIEERLVAWLRERPGAKHGDAVGRSATWPRPKP